MIQRIQSVFFLMASVSLLVITYKFPILVNNEIALNQNYFFLHSYLILEVLVYFSIFLPILAIFQFRNRVRQKIISNLARFIISIILILVFFYFKKDKLITSGLLLLIIPYAFLFFANFFIKKDENLIKSADRIR